MRQHWAHDERDVQREKQKENKKREEKRKERHKGYEPARCDHEQRHYRSDQ
jgi:hypothetical protein